ncbi:sulfite exporter TauE/SafE family protein [Thermosulfuriphilus sp.]
MELIKIDWLIPLWLFLGAFVHGLAGFGFALVAVPLLAFAYPLKAVVPLVAINGLIINLLLFYTLRGHFRLKMISPLLWGALPGIFIGVRALKQVPENPLRALLALILTAYGLFGLFSPQLRLCLRPSWGYLFGLMAGALGAALNTPGPPVVIYISLLALTKEEIKVALQGFFSILAVVIVGLYLAGGLITPFVIKWFLFSLPGVLLGLFGGHRLYGHLSETGYRRLIYFLLIALGLLVLAKR